MSSWRWKQLRQQIHRRDRGRCYRCGRPGQQIDHVMPIAEGGAKTDPANLAVICEDCHSDKTAEEVARSNRRRAGRA